MMCMHGYFHHAQDLYSIINIEMQEKDILRAYLCLCKAIEGKKMNKFGEKERRKRKTHLI